MEAVPYLYPINKANMSLASVISKNFILWAMIGCITAGGPSQGSRHDTFCESDMVEGRLDECLHSMTLAFRGAYYDDFLVQPSADAFYAICSLHQKWAVCAKTLSIECDLKMFDLEARLDYTKRVITDTCLFKRKAMTRNFECLRSQTEHNPLFRSCHDVKQFKIKANIYTKCSVVTKAIQCEDNLLRSACGSTIADFRLALTVEGRLPVESQQTDCLYEPRSSYDGFSYSLRCATDFPETLYECYQDFRSTYLVFHSSLRGVVKSSLAKIQTFCSAYDRYKWCIRPVQQLCPQGVRALYDMENEWDWTVSIAHYLCDTARTAYLAHLPCYTSLLQSPNLLSICRKVYENYPSQTEAYVIACGRNRQSKEKRRKREHLIQCYSTFVEKFCGSNASDVMLPMLRIHYSLTFLPPCQDDGVPGPCVSNARHRALDISGLLARFTLMWIVTFNTCIALQ